MESPEGTDLRNQGLLKIYAATQRASSIIENLLKFARPEGGLVKKKWIYIPRSMKPWLC